MNPVLREGNSDRRAPASVKDYARKHPHSMGAWSPSSRSHVATMSEGDFRCDRAVGHDRSATGPSGSSTSADDGTRTVLRDADRRCPQGDVLDAAVMRRAALERFLAEQVADARDRACCSPST